MIRDILWVATPRLRPPWHGRTKPLTADEAHILRVAVRSDGQTSWKAIFDVLGERRATAALSSLKKAGGLTHPSYGRYDITEKGRIAIALLDARLVWRPRAVEPEDQKP